MSVDVDAIVERKPDPGLELAGQIALAVQRLDLLLRRAASGQLWCQPTSLPQREASAWSGDGWVPLSALAGEGCDGAETLCAVCNGSLIEGGPWGSQQIEPGRFWELGVNAGALLGAQPTYITVRIRTPQDIAFGHFGDGN